MRQLLAFGQKCRNRYDTVLIWVREGSEAHADVVLLKNDLMAIASKYCAVTYHWRAWADDARPVSAPRSPPAST